MSCCASCSVGGPCSGDQRCAGPLGRPAYYRTITVDGSTASDGFEVGNNDPSQNGWALYTACNLGANARLMATMTLNGFWQSNQELEVGRMEWSRGGVIWIPFPSFVVDWQDAEGSGNESTVSAYARPILGGVTPSPIAFATSSASIDPDGGDEEFEVPAGATDYMLALYRNGGLAGDVQVEELNESGGATNPWGSLRYDNGDIQNGQAAGSDGYRPVPPGPGAIIRVTNAAAAGGSNAVTAAIRYRIDLTMTR